jgi:hypothetical protein
MSNTPTATAVAGKFQSKDGSDLVQYLNSAGQVVPWVDADGVLRINTTAAQGAVSKWDYPPGPTRCATHDARPVAPAADPTLDGLRVCGQLPDPR